MIANATDRAAENLRAALQFSNRGLDFQSREGSEFERTPLRTLGLYQPFASLMLYGKIETRVITLGKKPPFPLGPYLLYATKRVYTHEEVFEISGSAGLARIIETLKDEVVLNGHALCLGILKEVRPLKADDEDRAFVKFIQPYGILGGRQQWALVFEGVRRIEPFPFKGKQGVGFAKLDPGTIRLAKEYRGKVTCTACGGAHIDRDFWSFRPHRTHLCEHCGKTFLGAGGFDYPSYGVDGDQFLNAAYCDDFWTQYIKRFQL